MFKHVKTVIDGSNAIVSHSKLLDDWRIDIILCTDKWSPTKGYREFSSKSKVDGFNHAQQKFGISIVD